MPVSYPIKRPSKVTVPLDLVERARARAKEPLPKLSEAEAKRLRDQGEAPEVAPSPEVASGRQRG